MSWLGVLGATSALSGIIALRYLLISGGLYLWLWRGRGVPGARRLGRTRPERTAMAREVRLSLGASVITALPAAVALEAWKAGQGRLYTDPMRYGLAWLVVGPLVYLLVQDGFYYWVHRLMHHPALFGWAHLGHHRSREPTAFAAFAFDPAEAVATAWLLPALTFVVPLHVGSALALLTVISITAALNHSGWEVLPGRWVRGPLGAWLITATHHSGHHARMGTNYGLHFRLWDRLMRTEVMAAAGDHSEPVLSTTIASRVSAHGQSHCP